jgi:hypothetical protein
MAVAAQDRHRRRAAADLRPQDRAQGHDSNGNEIEGISDWDDFDTASTGTPRNWWIDDTSGTPTLVAYPVGSATFTVRYESDSATLSADR